MYATGKSVRKEALRLIDEVVKLAQAINKPVAVAVAGPEGELIGFLRMDGANAASERLLKTKRIPLAAMAKLPRNGAIHAR